MPVTPAPAKRAAARPHHAANCLCLLGWYLCEQRQQVQQYLPRRPVPVNLKPLRGAWVAQSSERRTSAQVVISRLMSSPAPRGREVGVPGLSGWLGWCCHLEMGRPRGTAGFARRGGERERRKKRQRCVSCEASEGPEVWLGGWRSGGRAFCRAVEAPGPEAQRGGSSLQTQPSRPCGSRRPRGSEQRGGWGDPALPRPLQPPG